MTNMTDPHTCPTRDVNLVLAGVLLTEGYFLKFTREMVGCSAVEVPVCVDAVGTISSGRNLFLIFGRSLIFFKMVPVLLAECPSLPQIWQRTASGRDLLFPPRRPLVLLEEGRPPRELEPLVLLPPLPPGLPLERGGPR